jgi:glycosyltransferase involved in cell wall biosynthesis
MIGVLRPMVLKMSAKPLSILYLIESAGRGGAETVVVALACARGKRARVGSLRYGWMCERLCEAEVPVEDIAYTRRSDILLALRIARLIEKTRPDVVHCHCFTMNTAGALGAALAGVPSVGTVHGAIYDLDTRGRRVAYRLAGKLHKRMVAVSQYLRAEMHQRAGIAKDKIEVIYNGVPTPDATDDGANGVRKELGLEGSDFVVGSVGMFRPEKGHADLIDAFAIAQKQVPRMKLLLVGDGRCKDDLAARARGHDLNGAVRIAGARSDVAQVLRAIDVFALPSHTEGLSIATIEAMSCGTPVVVTDCGGPTEIVNNEVTGLVVPPCDAQAMSEAIVRIAGDSTLRECLRSNGRARALDSFSLEGMLSSYDRLYREVAW